METETFGTLLRHYRLAARLTQEALAERAHLSMRAISELERGTRHTPRHDTVARLAAALQLSAEEPQRLEENVSSVRRPVQTGGSVPSETGTLPRWPRLLTRLIGREREEAAAAHLLRKPEVRLLTLTGPAGVGKTRLALQLAESQQAASADGACCLSLAALQEPPLVLSSLAEALPVRDSGSRPLLERLVTALSSKTVLLILHNFEHLLAAAPLLVELLAACPELKTLVTSRARLQVRGEYELVVPPLALPKLAALPALEGLEHYAALSLLVKPARPRAATFSLTAHQAPLVAEICV